MSSLADTPADVHTAAVDAWIDAHAAGGDASCSPAPGPKPTRSTGPPAPALAGELSGPVLEVRGPPVPGR